MLAIGPFIFAYRRASTISGVAFDVVARAAVWLLDLAIRQGLFQRSDHFFRYP